MTGDIEAQVRRVFDNLRAVSRAAGGDLANAVKLNVFLTDLGHFALVNEVMAEYFTQPYPARAAVGVAALPQGRGRRNGLRPGALRTGGSMPATAAAPLAERPVTALRGVGPALADTLAERLGLHTVQDVLFHLPLRYEDRTRVVPIGTLRNGDRAVIEGEVQLAEVVFRRRRALLVRLADGSGFITLRFFHFSSLAAGRARARHAAALLRRGAPRPGGLEIVHPEYRRVAPDLAAPAGESLTPIYPTTEGVQQGRLRALTELALAMLQRRRRCAICIPPGVLDAMHLPALEAALRYVHRPPPDANLDLLNDGRHPAQRRLAFEELLAHQLSLRLLRQAADRDSSWPLPRRDDLVERCLASLPFQLTGAQSRAWHEIARGPWTPAPDDAAGAGRRRLRQDRGRRAGRAARRRARRAGRGDGADRTAGRTARPQLRRAGSSRSASALRC